MAEITKQIDAVMNEALKGPLRDLGFRKKGRNFTRHLDTCIQVVNVQASRNNAGASGNFTVNLGVYFPVVATEQGKLATENPGEVECHLRERIGFLMGAYDHWWELAPGSSLATVTASLRDAVLRLGVPFLDSISTIEKAADCKVHGGTTWDRMMIQHLAGHDERILAEMKQELLKSDIRRWAWKEPAERYGFAKEYAELLELTRERFEKSKAKK